MAKYIGVVTGRKVLLSNADNIPVELVQNDKDTTIIDFELSKIDYVTADIDPSQLNVAINYVNVDKDTGDSVTDIYTVDKTTVEDDSLKFSWLVGSNASVYAGKCIFQLVLTLVDADGVITQQWDSIKCSIKVWESNENVNITQPKSFIDYITQVKKSVSDGKSKVASAITDKGVDTEATDTFDVMAKNIGKITGGGVSENMRTVTFYNGNNIVAINSAIINTYIQPPLNSEKKIYGVWKDNSGAMFDFPLKITNNMDLFKVGIIYDLSVGSLWQNGWSYSYDPERIYGDDYIMFSTDDDSGADRKNVIVTKNKYDLTNATLLHITLTTSNLVTSSEKPALVVMVADNQTGEWGTKNLLVLSGADIVDGGYWLDVSELTGEHYIQVSCHHSSTKGKIKISQIYIS